MFLRKLSDYFNFSLESLSLLCLALAMAIMAIGVIHSNVNRMIAGATNKTQETSIVAEQVDTTQQTDPAQEIDVALEQGYTLEFNGDPISNKALTGEQIVDNFVYTISPSDKCVFVFT